MKVLVSSINIQIEGPENGYLNVYKLVNGDSVRYVTGKKSYNSSDEAERKARPAPGWQRVGVIATNYYRNHVNAHVNDYMAALRVHVINDIDAFLAREMNAQAPTGIAGGLDTRPAQEEADVTEAPAKAPRKPKTAKKPVKASKGAKKAKKPAKRVSKPRTK